MSHDILLITSMVEKAQRALHEGRYADASMHLKQTAHLATVRSKAIDEEVRRALRASPFRWPITGEA